jgi:hypothetical protein
MGEAYLGRLCLQATVENVVGQAVVGANARAGRWGRCRLSSHAGSEGGERQKELHFGVFVVGEV